MWGGHRDGGTLEWAAYKRQPKMANVLVVGSINMDVVARVRRFPTAGETIHGSRLDLIPGGKGANQAIAAARLGGDTAIISRVGSDAFGDKLVGELSQAGILPLVEVSQGSSGIAVITVNRDGENSIVVIPGANGLVSPNDVAMYDEHFARADVVLTQFEIPPETVGAAVALARQHGKLTVVDPAPVPAAVDEIDAETWQCDFFSPNQSEAETLTGISIQDPESAVAAARQLLKLGPKTVVIKMGEQGAVLVNEDRALHQSTASVNAIDTTAAGDAFTAALATRYAETQNVEVALAWACAAGTLATQKIGAQSSIPTRKEVRGQARLLHAAEAF